MLGFHESDEDPQPPKKNHTVHNKPVMQVTEIYERFKGLFGVCVENARTHEGHRNDSDGLNAVDRQAHVKKCRY